MHTGDVIQERYKLENVLGQGSMGTTFRARDLHTHHPVAVKCLHLSRVQEWKALEMFEREADILRQLAHPRIPSYIDYFSLDSASDTQFFLVQEYIKGRTLQELIEQGWRGTEKEILEIFSQLIQILGYLHTLHPPVIHRDINPKNIILSPEGEVFLVDFGAVQERIRTTFLGGSTIVGTYGYVPFEQFSGQTVPASDYYAAGATLLYMLSHRQPSDFPTENMKPDFRASLQVSSNIGRLLDGLFESDAKKRISSPEEIRKFLKKRAIRFSKMQVDVFKPRKTNITKTAMPGNRLCFSVPQRQYQTGIKKILGGVLLTGFALAAGPGVIFGVIGLVVLASGLNSLAGRTILELTPEWVQVRKKCFQVEFGHSMRIPTAKLTPSHVAAYFHKKSLTSRFRKRRSVLGINHAGKTYEIGTKLTQQEAEWLAQEINEYITTFAKPLPENQSRNLEA